MAAVFVLNVVMLTRLGLLSREVPVSTRLQGLLCVLQLAPLAVLHFDWRVAVLAAVLVLANAAGLALERRGRHLAGTLLGTRFLVFSSIAVTVAALAGGLRFAGWLVEAFPALTAAGTLWPAINLIAGAVLILTNEVNLAIRYGFYRLNLEPKLDDPGTPADGAAPATDARQYNAGRVIGILERYFILTLLLAGSDLSALAVILAAKGLARFQQLDRREFAEYVLIGTLASALSAVLVGMAVRYALTQSGS